MKKQDRRQSSGPENLREESHPPHGSSQRISRCASHDDEMDILSFRIVAHDLAQGPGKNANDYFHALFTESDAGGKNSLFGWRMSFRETPIVIPAGWRLMH